MSDIIDSVISHEAHPTSMSNTECVRVGFVATLG